MPLPKLKYFRLREAGSHIELEALFPVVNEKVESEASSIFAILYYQTQKHIRLNLNQVDFMPLNFLNRILNLAMDLREKKRVLILAGISPAVHHFIARFSLQDHIFLPREGLLRKNPKPRAQIPNEFPNLPIEAKRVG